MADNVGFCCFLCMFFHMKKFEDDPKGEVSRLAKIRKPQCTDVHEDFRIKRNAENTLLSHPRLVCMCRLW